MKYLITVMGLLMSSVLGLTAEPDSKFAIEEGLVEKIYKETLSEAKIGSADGALGLEISLSMVQPSHWNLTNDYFTVQYTENISAIPVLDFSVNIPVLRMGRVQFLMRGKVGYGYQTGVYQFRSDSGNIRSDNVQIHWLPVGLALQTEYDTGTFISPFVGLGGGVQLHYQVATLDGFSQGFWIPFFEIRPGIRLFGSSNGWFGGIATSVSFLESFASNQVFSGWSLDTGIHINM